MCYNKLICITWSSSSSPKTINTDTMQPNSCNQGPGYKMLSIEREKKKKQKTYKINTSGPIFAVVAKTLVDIGAAVVGCEARLTLTPEWVDTVNATVEQIKKPCVTCKQCASKLFLTLHFFIAKRENVHKECMLLHTHFFLEISCYRDKCSWQNLCKILNLNEPCPRIHYWIFKTEPPQHYYNSFHKKVCLKLTNHTKSMHDTMHTLDYTAQHDVRIRLYNTWNNLLNAWQRVHNTWHLHAYVALFSQGILAQSSIFVWQLVPEYPGKQLHL